MKVKIEIDTKTFVRFWLVVIGFMVIGLALYSARMALIVIGLAAFFAIILSLPVNKIANRLPGKSRAFSTALAYLAVVLVLGSFVFLAVPPIVGQTAKLARTVPVLVDTASQQYSSLTYFIEKNHLEDQFQELTVAVKNRSTKLAQDLGSNLIDGIGSVFSVVLAGVMVFFLTFFMLVEGPAWIERAWGLFKDKKKMAKTKNLIDSMYKVITSYFAGQVMVASVASIVSATMILIASLIFNIPLNLAIPTAAIMFVFSLIPMFGSGIGLMIITAVLLLNDFKAAIIYFCLYVVYQQIEGNFISPKIQSKKIDLSALWILIAIIIGIYLFGLAGGIISIPIAGCIKVLADHYYNEIRQKNLV